MVVLVDTMRSPRDETDRGRSKARAVADDPKKGVSDQWLKDLVDLQQVGELIDQDMKRQIQRAILIRRFGEFG
jgi:hypothetical protein